MVCLQLKVYLGYLVAQLLLSLFLFGSQRLRFGIIEVLVGLVVGLGVLNNLSLLRL